MASHLPSPPTLQPITPSGPACTYFAAIDLPSTIGVPAHQADVAIETTNAAAAASAKNAPRAREAMPEIYHVVSASSAAAAVDAVRNRPRTEGRRTSASTAWSRNASIGAQNPPTSRNTIG